jgi:hypothetical protein
MGGWHGLTATASYTYSRTFDNASEVYSSVGGGNTLSFAQDPFNTDRGERAISGLDYPHLASVTLVYDIPFLKEQHGFVGHLLGGWQSGITYRYATGQPYTTIQFHNPTSLCDPTRTMSGTYDACRPILSNASLPQNTIGQYCDGSPSTCVVDPATGSAEPLGTLIAFNDPCYGSYDPMAHTGCTPASISGAHWIYNDNGAAAFLGTPFAGAGRDTLRGQPISTGNLAFYKDIKVTERLMLQFQAQCFNCMNVQFRGTPVSVLDLATPSTPGSPSPFQSTAYNFNGGGNNFVGGGTFSSNSVYDGIGRRRLLFGLKLKF